MITKETAEWLTAYVAKHPIAKTALCAKCLSQARFEASAEHGYGSARYVCSNPACECKSQETAISEDAQDLVDKAHKIWNAKMRKTLNQLAKKKNEVAA